MISVPEFEGNAFAPGTRAYKRTNDIYATSTYGTERDLNPGVILEPTSIEDIQKVIKYATVARKPISIRTGGHQYSGACSIGPDGIQLDLKPTFRRPKLDLDLIRDTAKNKVFMRSSVSWTLSEIFDFFTDNGIFMPTGQCATVCLGGHVQTGGYGMLSRSFGLLADYIMELEIIDHNADVVKITKESHPDLFFGFLGGSPGNMGVLTHFTVEVQQDQKHQGSKGQWMAFPYRHDTMKALIDIAVEYAEDPNLERNTDLIINVLSKDTNLVKHFPGSESELEKLIPSRDGKKMTDILKTKEATIVVWAQWVRFDRDVFSSDLFDRINNVPRETSPKDTKFGKETPEGFQMSEIITWWRFEDKRELEYPYVKRLNTTKSTTLSKNGYSKWFSQRITDAVTDKDNGLFIISQIQVMGGPHAMLRKNANNGTAYCWRDTTLGGTWDAFYKHTREKAEEWQKKNDEGARIYFSAEDRRLLWASYGDWNMKNVWQHYYDPDTYRRLQAIRKAADPNGVFTSNPFCVEAAE